MFILGLIVGIVIGVFVTAWAVVEKCLTLIELVKEYEQVSHE